MDFDLSYHLAQFPHSSVVEKEGRLYGIWMIGNNYKRKKGYYGEYPPSYLDRVLSLMGDEPPRPRLHLFSGSVVDPEAITLDINPATKPTVCGDAEKADACFDLKFKVVFADPPYSKMDASIYGYKMPRANIVLQSLFRIVSPGGLVVWLSTKPPMYRKTEWLLRGTIGLHCGTNRVFRCVTFLERVNP